jgi:hypothetical protein
MRTEQTNTRDQWHRRSDHDTTPVPVPHLIGVGVDGAPAGRDAVVLAAVLARATQAELMLIAIFEQPLLEGVVPAELDTGARAHVDVVTAAPADGLRELCDHVDLLVIGSGHAGASGRVQLGSAGRRLLGDAPARILIAPRPRHAATV